MAALPSAGVQAASPRHSSFRMLSRPLGLLCISCCRAQTEQGHTVQTSVPTTAMGHPTSLCSIQSARHNLVLFHSNILRVIIPTHLSISIHPFFKQSQIYPPLAVKHMLPSATGTMAGPGAAAVPDKSCLRPPGWLHQEIWLRSEMGLARSRAVFLLGACSRVSHQLLL